LAKIAPILAIRKCRQVAKWEKVGERGVEFNSFMVGGKGSSKQRK
jgi:hypothetical protein